jgi:N-succinyldiaminopimelate aminotransferase
MKPINQIVTTFEESIFSAVTKMATQHQAVNLAQGFPDFDGPGWISDLAYKAMQNKRNQYAPSFGLLSLREAIRDQYEKYYQLKFNPASEILVTNGATEAIYLACAALLNPGDEVIVFAPSYDCYVASIKMAKAEIKAVPLHAPDFLFDEEYLKKQITSRTKMLILNSPHNPTGKIFSQKELDIIAKLAIEHDFIIISDDVYEFITFETNFLPIAKNQDLRNRVISVSSIGKTLSLTGWKVGWACGPANLISAMHLVHQFVTFCVVHPLQAAIAEALPRLDEYIVQLKKDYKEKRDFLVEGLKSKGAKVLVPQGTYFALVEIPTGFTDKEYCKKLMFDHKLAAIPMSAFYLNADQEVRYIRFCFAKEQATLASGIQRYPQN